MSKYKDALKEQTKILKYLVPECDPIYENYSIFDAILDTPDKLILIEYKRRPVDIGNTTSLVIDRRKLKNLIDCRTDLYKIIKKPISIVYINVLNDRIYFFNIDTLIKDILAKSNTILKKPKPPKDINVVIDLSKVTYGINIKLAFKELVININDILK